MTVFSGNPGYALSWPPETLAEEVDSLAGSETASGMESEWVQEAMLLLRQAFTSPVPADDFWEVAGEIELFVDYGDADPCVLWLRDLSKAALNLSLGPSRYYSDRHPDNPDASKLPLGEVARQVRSLVDKLLKDGFFDETFGVRCPVTEEGRKPSPEHELGRLVGKRYLWTADPEEWWDDADLFDFIEVFHDLAARPTKAWFCRHCHDHHPLKFSHESGRAIYRALVNRLLDKSSIELRIAESGEDAGRMVRTTPDEMGELVNDALGAQSPDHDEIAHAIATFRHRGGTAEQRRSAVVSLAGILEKRRQLLKDELLSGDEKALFQIANQFSLRHRDSGQRDDYDPEFLDWIFYWYLATINLTDRLLAKRDGRRTATAITPVPAADPGYFLDEEPF